MQKEIYNILLADDDEDDRDFFKEAISSIPIKTNLTMVSNGAELIKHLTTPGIILPHLIFLDLNMPCKNGMDCLDEIRSNANLKNLTVAIYSTSTAPKDIEDCFIKGANIYIKKPNDFLKLKKLLAQVLEINWQYRTSSMDKDNFLLSI